MTFFHDLTPEELNGNAEPLDTLQDSVEVQWLRRCLPIIYQPEIDVNNQNHLVKILYEFDRDELTNQLNCKLYVIYAGEASYRRVKEHVQNSVATFFYRSFNRKVYKRTADINHLEYRDIDLAPESTMPWKSIFTTDHAGEQTWAQGDKGNILTWFSLMHHYKQCLGYHYWEKTGHRPHMFLNTCNHMWGEKDNNSQMKKYEWTNYPVQCGGSLDALTFSQKHIPTKRNCYSCCCFWRARNGGGCCDRVKHDAIDHSGESFYVLHEDKGQYTLEPKENLTPRTVDSCTTEKENSQQVTLV